MQLTPRLLFAAYRQGAFPMGHDDGEIYWYDPDPRCILPLDTFHVPRSLAQTIRHGGFEVRFNTAFRQVMLACAEPAPGREQTWITAEILAAYCQFHELGFAHSVETWVDGQLVGGLYGVAIGGLFAGESMFSHRQDASKIALVYLVERLRTQGFVLHDTQFMTEHLRRFGAIEIPRAEYHRQLQQALTVRAVL
ncbi:MAG: leucyl/phenylalanyl-tRNA--protein transferase [Chloroflexi bacterium]|nr:leucyl/phenylalanyl-tRNA--protein transferase [Chloroflexota bacterium]